MDAGIAFIIGTTIAAIPTSWSAYSEWQEKKRQDETRIVIDEIHKHVKRKK
jgi:hypothetical protein